MTTCRGARWSQLPTLAGARLSMSPKNVKKVRQSVLFIWSVSIIWLNQTNQRDLMDQTDQAYPDVRTIKVLLCRNSFSEAC